MPPDDDYYVLDPSHTDPKRMKKEREKAQKLRKTQWWLDQVNRGLCHYCGRKFVARELTMDHIVPLARGGTSTQGNIVPACRECNRDKKLETPAERLLKELAREREIAERQDASERDVSQQELTGDSDEPGGSQGESE